MSRSYTSSPLKACMMCTGQLYFIFYCKINVHSFSVAELKSTIFTTELILFAKNSSPVSDEVTQVIYILKMTNVKTRISYNASTSV
jgi:hypothetical protein